MDYCGVAGKQHENPDRCLALIIYEYGVENLIMWVLKNSNSGSNPISHSKSTTKAIALLITSKTTEQPNLSSGSPINPVFWENTNGIRSISKKISSVYYSSPPHLKGCGTSLLSYKGGSITITKTLFCSITAGR